MKNKHICQHAKEKGGLLYRYVDKVLDRHDADAECLFEQQLNLLLVLVKPMMLLLDPSRRAARG